jgi:Flp pilus assembly protein TadD
MKNRNRPAPGKAIDAFKAGDFNAAIRICRRHMRKTRADPETLKLLVQALLQSAHPEEACKEAGRLMLLAPDDADASLLLGHALRFNGRLRDARGHFEQAVASHPEDARAWHELALARRDQGPMEAVIEAFDRACTLDPHNAIYRDNHLLALLEAGRAREAISRCREALENTGYPGDLQQILGQALMQSGDYPAARTAFEQALAAAPGNLEIMGNLATCLATLGEHERGIHLLRQCVTSSRSSLPVRKNLARALAEAGYADEALAELEGIARRADPVPNDLSAAKLARQLILDQRLDEADALLELALTASPADQALRSERARLLISLHTYDEAESLLDDLTRSGQENGAMHALLVLLYCATDRHRHALEVMQGKLHDKEHKRRLLEGLLYQLNYSDTCPRETLYHMHLEWASTLETNPPTRPPSYEPQDHDPERRLRIGC